MLSFVHINTAPSPKKLWNGHVIFWLIQSMHLFPVGLPLLSNPSKTSFLFFICFKRYYNTANVCFLNLNSKYIFYMFSTCWIDAAAGFIFLKKIRRLTSARNNIKKPPLSEWQREYMKNESFNLIQFSFLHKTLKFLFRIVAHGRRFFKLGAICGYEGTGILNLDIIAVIISVDNIVMDTEAFIDKE